MPICTLFLYGNYCHTRHPFVSILSFTTGDKLSLPVSRLRSIADLSNKRTFKCKVNDIRKMPLLICLFVVLCHTQEFFTHSVTLPLLAKGFKGLLPLKGFDSLLLFFMNGIKIVSYSFSSSVIEYNSNEKLLES